MVVPVYGACPADDIVATMAEGLMLLFHRPSGATHILSSPLPEIWQALAAGAADSPTIAERLAIDHDIGPRPEAEAIVAARLDELWSLGLVERR